MQTPVDAANGSARSSYRHQGSQHRNRRHFSHRAFPDRLRRRSPPERHRARHGRSRPVCWCDKPRPPGRPAAGSCRHRSRCGIPSGTVLAQRSRPCASQNAGAATSNRHLPVVNVRRTASCSSRPSSALRRCRAAARWRAPGRWRRNKAPPGVCHRVGCTAESSVMVLFCANTATERQMGFKPSTQTLLQHAGEICEAKGARLLTDLRREDLGLILDSRRPDGRLRSAGQAARDAPRRGAADGVMGAGVPVGTRAHSQPLRARSPPMSAGGQAHGDADHAAQFLTRRTCGQVTELDDHELAHALEDAARRLGFTVGKGRRSRRRGSCATRARWGSRLRNRICCIAPRFLTMETCNDAGDRDR